jgi:hypothetical protein
MRAPLRASAPLRLSAGLIAAWLVLASSAAPAAPLIWIGDAAGNLVTVDIGTGEETLIGPMGVTFDDVAFDPDGNLWGLQSDNLYQINTSTGAAFGQTEVRSQFGFPLGGNAMTFGSDGTLYIAGSCILNPTTFEIGLGCISASDPDTGQGTVLGATGRSPSGDLAFHEGSLYYTSANFSIPSAADDLILVNFANVAASTVVGNTGVQVMFGLDTGADGTLYGVAVNSIYEVDPATAAATFIRAYTIGGAQANGASFPVTPIPLPGTALLLMSGFVLAGLRSRRLRG